ncbi:MAG TPA: hypothetical protein VI488_10055 [Candidatus Angelobacter sp.]
MKSYSMVAATILVAAQWLGANPRVCMVQQPATEANAWHSDPNHAAGATSAQAAATAANPAGGQVSPAAPSPAGQAAFYILAEFTQPLNAKKLKPGDPIKAEVTQDVLSHGRIIIPIDSKLIGHVTEVKSHQAEDPESRLGIIFDKVLLKHRREVDFRGVLHALSAPAMKTSRVDEPDQMMSPSMMGMNRSSGATPIGGGSSSMNRGPSNNGGSVSSATNPAGAPPSFTNSPPMTNVPTVSAGNSYGGIPNKTAPPPVSSGEQKPMSVGMPLGVFGLKGLSLTMGATANTPGPVILSRMDNVKLESGTQVLVKIFDATVPQP